MGAEAAADSEAVAVPIVVVTEAAARMVVAGTRIMAASPTPPSPGTEAPSILIFPQASGRGAAYIIAGGARLIFVRNQHPAHGKILLHQSNETGTSPAVT